MSEFNTSASLQIGTVFGRLDNEDSARLAEFGQDDPKNSVLSNYEAYQFEGRKGKRITIQVKTIKENEEGFMPQLMIVRQLNNGEKQILPVSAQTKGLDSTLEFPVPEDGTYFLIVGSSKKGEGGSYKLTVK